MKTIVAADIRGITPSLQALFAPLGPDVLFASPWADGACPCSSEAESVAYFLAQQGLQTYASRLVQMDGGEPAFFVGLSVGASSVWLYAATAACHAQSEVRFAHSGLGAPAPTLPHHTGVCRARAVF